MALIKVLLYQLGACKTTDLASELRQDGYQVAVSHVQEDVQAPWSGEMDIVLVEAFGESSVSLRYRTLLGFYPTVPFLLLTAKDVLSGVQCKWLSETSILYFPFTMSDVLARMGQLLAEEPPVLQVGDLSLNLETNCVYRGCSIHRLTPKQAKLLEVFMRYPERTLTRKFLMETIWNTDYMGDTRTLDVHVRWIRERIEEEPSSPQYLRTVRGVGYRFGVPPADIEGA